MPPLSTAASARRLTQRKRAPIACQFCRLRKTKCDGVKPVCGFCQYHEAQCVWGTVDDLGSTPTEKQILRRLDELKVMLSDHCDNDIAASESPHHRVLDASPQTGPATHAYHDPRSPQTAASQASAFGQSAPPISPFYHTRCERVFSWPVFQHIVDPAVVLVESFVVECDRVDDSDTVSASSSPPARPEGRGKGRGVQDHLLLPLCRKFLGLVHPRNPILDEAELVRYAKRDAEHGIQWDGPSCLVLIACALASYTAPWERSDPEDDQGDDDATTAEAYYLAAKKRIGLLGWSLIDIQCLFFASVYEKYALNPLQAWFYIQQASSRLQAHLKRRSQKQKDSTSSNLHPTQNHLMQRVFWSVYKAEHELLPELPFKSSGIEELTRADSMFPSLPVFDSESLEFGSGSRPSLSEEQSWAFYLAEISIRRTVTDTVVTLYRKGEGYWLNHIQSLTEQCKACESQIQLWYSHLPPSVRFERNASPNNELAFYLQGRFYQWRTYVLRPLMYYVLHRPASQALTPQITAYAQELVSVCADFIVHSNRGHRHGGTWFSCRASHTCALIILGVVVKADPLVPAPLNWQALVTMAISVLRRWEAQSQDLQRLRNTLEQLFSATCALKENIYSLA